MANETTSSDPLSEPVRRIGPAGVERVTVGQLWREARDAAESRGAPDPRACADRYLQGRELLRDQSRAPDADEEGGE